MPQLVPQDGGGGRQTREMAEEKGGDGQRAWKPAQRGGSQTADGSTKDKVKEPPRKSPTSQGEESTVFVNKEKQTELKHWAMTTA